MKIDSRCRKERLRDDFDTFANKFKLANLARPPSPEARLLKNQLPEEAAECPPLKDFQKKLEKHLL